MKDPNSYRVLSFTCFLAATCHILSGAFVIALAYLGHLEVLSSSQLLSFVPDHIPLWRVFWLAQAAATLFFLLFVVAFTNALEKQQKITLTMSLLLVVISTSNALNAQFSMLVLFPDLAQEQTANYSYLTSDLFRFSWQLLSQAAIQQILIANTLNGIAGLILTICALQDRYFPRTVSWFGLPVWLVVLNASIVAAMGKLDLAVLLMIISAFAFAIWVSGMGLVLTHMIRKALIVQEKLDNLSLP